MPKPSHYITAIGHRRLKQELDELWRKTRPEVTRALSAAAAEGDRSENAEYIYRKKQLREIDRRIRYLSKRMDVLRIVDQLPQDQGAIYFGAIVTLEVIAGEEPAERRYRLVGADEADPKNGDISIDAPLSRALLRKRVGDDVFLNLPERQEHFEIVEISYKQQTQ